MGEDNEAGWKAGEGGDLRPGISFAHRGDGGGGFEASSL